MQAIITLRKLSLSNPLVTALSKLKVMYKRSVTLSDIAKTPVLQDITMACGSGVLTHNLGTANLLSADFFVTLYSDDKRYDR
jgi:hypothetical protein